MAKYSTPGLSEVWVVNTVSDYTAVTAAEANAGTDITSFIRTLPDIPRTANTVDVAVLSSKFEARQVGTRGGDMLTIEVLRDTVTDTAWTTLTEDLATYLLVARKGLASAGTWATSDVCDVYPITIASRAHGSPSRNDPDFGVISAVITADPDLDQTI